MVIEKKIEAVAIAYLNLKIPYAQADSLVSELYERYSQYDYEILAQWILAGDVSYVDGKLVVAPYVTPDALDSLILRMRGAGGLMIKDRRYKLKVYSKCFVGSEAVDWLMENLDISQQEAARIGKRLLYRGIIHHVLDDQDFKDDYLFYRFYADEWCAFWPIYWSSVLIVEKLREDGWRTLQPEELTYGANFQCLSP